MDMERKAEGLGWRRITEEERNRSLKFGGPAHISDWKNGNFYHTGSVESLLTIYGENNEV